MIERDIIKIYDQYIYDGKIINTIANIHIKAFPNFFLTQLGYGFLKTLYKGYIDDKQSGLIIAEFKNEIVGFIAYSYNYPNFFRELIKKKLIFFAFYSLIAILKHPEFIKKLFTAFQKSKSVEKKVQYVQLASICVRPKVKGNGIGTEMISYLKKIVDFNQYSFICLETDAKENDYVNSFYIRNGFVLSQCFISYGNRLMNEYRYYNSV